MSLKGDSLDAAGALEKDGFDLFESDVAAKLAISRKQLASWRKKTALVRGEHWEFREGRVCFSNAGVEKASRLITGEEKVPVLALLEKDRNGLEELTVVGHPVNPMMVICQRKNGDHVRVRVRLARVFVVGMVIACRQVEPEFYTYEGPAPRWGRDPRFLPKKQEGAR